jgi:hypothetical protein
MATHFALQHKQTKHWIHDDNSLTVMKSCARVFETSADAISAGQTWLRVATVRPCNLIVHEVLTVPKISRRVRELQTL